MDSVSRRCLETILAAKFLEPNNPKYPARYTTDPNPI